MSTALIDRRTVSRPNTSRAVDATSLATAVRLRHRAQGLRTQARALEPVLASTYRRRAAELELQAWVAEVASGLPADQLAS